MDRNAYTCILGFKYGAQYLKAWRVIAVRFKRILFFSFESSLVFDVSNCIVLPSWRNYFVDAFLFEKAVGHFECKYQGKRVVDQRHLTSEN